MSARLMMAKAMAPTKKPSCIAPVIQAAPVADSDHRSTSAGNTAVAENRNGTTQCTATTNNPILAVPDQAAASVAMTGTLAATGRICAPASRIESFGCVIFYPGSVHPETKVFGLLCSESKTRRGSLPISLPEMCIIAAERINGDCLFQRITM